MQGDIGREFEGWLSRWPFQLFLTLTEPARYGMRFVSLATTERMTRFFKAYERKSGRKIGVIGLAMQAYSGHRHSHLLVLNEENEPFTELECDWLRKTWRHDADARKVDCVRGVAGYIAQSKHLDMVSDREIVIYGSDVLNQPL